MKNIIIHQFKEEKNLTTDDKRQILIVDDEDHLRKLLGDVLIGEGYEITSAFDGEEAISLLHKNRFDIAILDIQMPNLNGIEVLKFITKHHPALKAIMLTGYGNLKYAMEAKEYGAVDFIGKPYKLEDVVSTIERVLKE